MKRFLFFGNYLCIEEQINSADVFLLLNQNDLVKIGFTTIGSQRLILNQIAEINKSNYIFYYYDYHLTKISTREDHY